jgi:hypothetical protein
MFGIGCLKINEFKSRSGATSLFDVQRWTFDVRRSSFKNRLESLNCSNGGVGEIFATRAWRNSK